MTEPTSHASDAAKNLRTFLHATFTTSPDWQDPAHTTTALGALARLTRMLPQAIQQALLPVSHTHKQGRLTIDGGADPDEEMALLLPLLNDALQHAERLVWALDALHTETASMGARVDEDGDNT